VQSTGRGAKTDERLEALAAESRRCFAIARPYSVGYAGQPPLLFELRTRGSGAQRAGPSGLA
jgi:hypothetical protein